MADTVSPSNSFSSVPVQTLLARYKEAEAGRKKHDSTWERNINLRDNRAWQGIPKAASSQTEPQYNKVHEFIETMRGFLSDNKWGLDVTPLDSPDGTTDEKAREVARKANRVLDFLWYDNDMQAMAAAVGMDVFSCGTGFIKSTFDPDNIGTRGIGQIETHTVSPFYIYPDPDATCVEDAAFLIEAHPVSLRWVAKRYPDKIGEIVKAAGGNELQLMPSGIAGLRVSPSDEGKRIDLLECWYEDESVIDFEDSEGNVQVQQKYQRGRRTLMTKSGIVLEDGECLYNHWPYIRFVEILKPGEFWGGCTVDKVADIQLMINQVLRSIIDNGLWLVHGIWIVDRTSGVSAKTLAGYQPRDTIVKNPGSTVSRETGASLPPHLFQTLQELIDAFDRVAGIPDVLRGIVPSRQPVQTTMIQQESGEVRTRERSRRYEESLSTLARHWLSIAAEHWTDTRTITSRKATGGWEGLQVKKGDLAGWEWGVYVVPGSTTPINRAEAMAEAKSLRQELGIQIPDSYFLNLSNLPGVQSAIQEMEDAAKQAAGGADTTGGGGAQPSNSPPMPDLSQWQYPNTQPGDQTPTPQDLASLSPEEIAQLQQAGGAANLP